MLLQTTIVLTLIKRAKLSLFHYLFVFRELVCVFKYEVLALTLYDINSTTVLLCDSTYKLKAVS